jgi:hypothetical protein
MAAKNSAVPAMSSAEPVRFNKVRSTIFCCSAASAILLGHMRGPSDTVDAHLRTEFARERTREHDETGFGRAVDGYHAVESCRRR